MTYWMPSCCGNMEAAQVKGGPRYQLHPGLLAENLVQATARDVLASAWLRCVDAGYCPVMSVHDELVFECDEADAPAVRDAVTEIMVEPRRWSQGLPVEVEAKISRRYGK
jgi:DNA polymerase